MDVGGLAMSMAFSVGACVGGGWWCIKRLSEARFLLNTPTSKIRSAAQGYVELYGVVDALPDGAQLAGPLTGQPCLWWRFKIEEYDDDGKHKRWRTVESGTSAEPIRLKDATGECLVDPRGAEVRPATRDVWHGSERHPLGASADTGLLSALFSSGEYRYTEERLHAGQPLYAIGDFHTLGGAEAFDLTLAQGAVVREWKGDFAGLLQRFDSNGDGELGPQEWERMRESARAEAQRRQLQRGDAPVHNQLRRPRESYPFILACAGEDELAKSFYWQALAGGVLCLLGALATTWLLLNVVLPELG